MKPSSVSQLEIERTAAHWAVRRREGLDTAAMQEFMAWLEHPEHGAAYERFAGMASVFERARATGASTALVTQLRARQLRRRQVRGAIFAAAACVALVFVLFSAPWARQDGATRVAQAEALRRLPDGSIVELRPGAELAVRYDAGVRRVELTKGEALFRVEKDASRPFIVRAKGVDVRAVGTAFNVRLDAASVEVLVTEGRVRVLNAEKGRSVLPSAPDVAEPVLSSGQRCVVALADDGPVPDIAAQVEALAPEQVRATLAWRLPRLDFEGVRLGSAVEQLNAQNRVQLRLADPALATLRLSGTFSPDDPATFARLVAATFDLRVAESGEAIVLARE
jgi:transmembrane sensor